MATKFITVSIEIMHDKNLNQSQKFILAEIEQLSQLDNGCFASNRHFSDLIGITKENVSRNINELEKMGYIGIEIKKGSRNHTRIITITTLVRHPYQSSKTPLLKQQETKDNIQSNKTINKTKEATSLLTLITEKRIESQGLVNQHALDEWLSYKKYKNITGVTKTINFLSNYSFEIQQKIVDTSIMNGYKGLFEPKQEKQQQPYNTPKSQTLNTDVNVWDEIEKQEQRMING